MLSFPPSDFAVSINLFAAFSKLFSMRIRLISVSSTRPVRPSEHKSILSFGFNWGYAGSGPSQLALALLYDVTGKAEVALIAHQGFKHDVIAKLPTEEDWQLTSIQIENWIEELKVKVDGWIKDTMDPTA